MRFLPYEPARRLLAVIVTGAVLVGGCLPSTPNAATAADGGVGVTCAAKCQADTFTAGASVCGTDMKTYPACAWQCGEVPAGVGTYPGACRADGSPPADAPPGPADGDLICGWLKIGSEWEAVGCADDYDLSKIVDDATYLDGSEGSTVVAQSFVLGVGTIHPRDGTPTSVPDIDHRARYGAPKNQGTASACTAFGFVAVLEGAIAATIGQKVALSEMHLWGRYHKPQIDLCAEAMEKGAIATDADATMNSFPYDPTRAKAWEDSTSTPDAATLAKLDGAAQFALGKLSAIKPAGGTMKVTARQLQQALVDGLDVWVAANISDGWANPSGGVIADYGASGKDGHAFAIVGIKTIHGVPYFIVRNSWGPTWADGGYGYISFQTLEDNLLAAAVVGIRRKGESAPPVCPTGQSADLAGACRTVCMDGTLANESGSCVAPRASCVAGQVSDASAICVAACRAGESMGAGYKVSCTDRACTWIVDDGAQGCRGQGLPCTKTCPAPTCAAAVRKNELGHTIWECAGPAR